MASVVSHTHTYQTTTHKTHSSRRTTGGTGGVAQRTGVPAGRTTSPHQLTNRSPNGLQSPPTSARRPQQSPHTLGRSTSSQGVASPQPSSGLQTPLSHPAQRPTTPGSGKVTPNRRRPTETRPSPSPPALLPNGHPGRMQPLEQELGERSVNEVNRSAILHEMAELRAQLEAARREVESYRESESRLQRQLNRSQHQVGELHKQLGQGVDHSSALSQLQDESSSLLTHLTTALESNKQLKASLESAEQERGLQKQKEADLQRMCNELEDEVQLLRAQREQDMGEVGRLGGLLREREQQHEGIEECLRHQEREVAEMQVMQEELRAKFEAAQRTIEQQRAYAQGLEKEDGAANNERVLAAILDLSRERKEDSRQHQTALEAQGERLDWLLSIVEGSKGNIVGSTQDPVGYDQDQPFGAWDSQRTAPLPFSPLPPGTGTLLSTSFPGQISSPNGPIHAIDQLHTPNLPPILEEGRHEIAPLYDGNSSLPTGRNHTGSPEDTTHVSIGGPTSRTPPRRRSLTPDGKTHAARYDKSGRGSPRGSPRGPSPHLAFLGPEPSHEERILPVASFEVAEGISLLSPDQALGQPSLFGNASSPVSGDGELHVPIPQQKIQIGTHIPPPGPLPTLPEVPPIAACPHQLSQMRGEQPEDDATQTGLAPPDLYEGAGSGSPAYDPTFDDGARNYSASPKELLSRLRGDNGDTHHSPIQAGRTQRVVDPASQYSRHTPSPSSGPEFEVVALQEQRGETQTPPLTSRSNVSDKVNLWEERVARTQPAEPSSGASGKQKGRGKVIDVHLEVVEGNPNLKEARERLKEATQALLSAAAQPE